MRARRALCDGGVELFIKKESLPIIVPPGVSIDRSCCFGQLAAAFPELRVGAQKDPSPRQAGRDGPLLRPTLLVPERNTALLNRLPRCYPCSGLG